MHRLIHTIQHRLLRPVLSVLYPRQCPGCGMVIEEDAPCICDACLRHMPYTEQMVLSDNRTEEVFVGIRGFDRGAALLWYEHESIVQHIILNSKFGRNADPAPYEWLGQEAGRRMVATGWAEGIDCIVPVPLHPRRLHERGFNQAEVIARAIGEQTGIPVDTTHLTRAINNEHQARLRKGERNANAEHIFVLNHPEELYRKHILLVDDIVTTGNTLRSCMETMYPIRGARFSIFALARAR